jgi:hypothetical protein
MSRDPGGNLFMRLGPSTRLGALFAGLHLGAIPCVFANELPMVMQAMLALALLYSGGRTLALHATRRARHAIVVLVWDRHGQWRLLQRDGELLQGRLEHGAFAHPRLTVLPFRCASGQRLCVLLVPGMVDDERWRQLRVRLRCQPAQAA